MTRLLILGLDGATFNVIKPLCNEDKLPTLNRLIADGTHGVLESTFPPVTGPAWTALATGKNPGKTGIFDTFNRSSKDDFGTKVMSSVEVRKAKAYWDYLSNAGAKVGVINYPFLYPPYEINGIMVSGLGSSPMAQISYPKNFKQRVLKKCGKYRIDVPWYKLEYSNNPSPFFKDIFELLEINTKILQLSLEEDLEVLTFVISASDFAQHYMWRYIDRSHPYYREDEAEKYRPMFIQVWDRIDEMLSSVIERTSKNVNVIIVSDHGFGPHRAAFYTNSWLEQEGYLTRKSKSIKARRFQDVAVELIAKVSPYLYNKLRSGVRAGKLPYIQPTAELDLARSLAFSPRNASLVGKIYINTQGELFKSRGGDLQSIISEIAGKLSETCRELDISLKVHSPYELYTGQYVGLAPDILFEIEDGECSIHFRFGKEAFQKPPPTVVHSGIHKKEGIFIGYGPDVKQGVQIEGAKIYDVAPTILHLLGLPVPDDMDGRVLQEIFREGSEPAQREVKYQKVDAEKEKVKGKIEKLKKSGKL